MPGAPTRVNRPFLSQRDVNSALAFRYSGKDNSPLYIHVLSPIADFLIDKVTPKWIAPNVITVAALGCAVVSFIACAVVLNPSLSLEQADAMPRWAPALASICLLVYQTLDNMDGKQARRIGLRSPLGLIVDHGCDALHAGVLGPATAAAVLGTGAATWQTAVIFMVGVAPFFTNSWESFHIGTFILPIVNGPSDGLCLIATVFGATAVFGPLAWHQPAPSWATELVIQALTSIPVFDTAALSQAAREFLKHQPMINLCLAYMSFMTFATVSYQLVSVLFNEASHGLRPASSAEETGAQHHTEDGDRPHAPRGGVGAAAKRVVRALIRLFPLALLAVAVIGTIQLTPSMLNRVPALGLACFGFAFADMTIRIMVGHVTVTEPSLVAGIGNVIAAGSPAALEWLLLNTEAGASWLTPSSVTGWVVVVTLLQALKIAQLAVAVAVPIGRATGIPLWSVPKHLLEDHKGDKQA